MVHTLETRESPLMACSWGRDEKVQTVLLKGGAVTSATRSESATATCKNHTEYTLVEVHQSLFQQEVACSQSVKQRSSMCML